MKKNILLTTFLVLPLIAAVPASAIDLKPGKWGINVVMESPMTQQPMQEYTEECVEGTGYDPLEGMMEGEMASMCKITVSEDGPEVMDAELSCAMPGGAGSMTGSIDFRVNGESATGSMLMNMNFGGQAMAMNTSWTAEYLGSCN